MLLLIFLPNFVMHDECKSSIIGAILLPFYIKVTDQCTRTPLFIIFLFFNIKKALIMKEFFLYGKIFELKTGMMMYFIL